MELLYSRATPGPEFVSLSILLRSDISSGSDGTPISCNVGGGEPLLLSGPLSTISQSSCVEVLTELHFYINSILKASSAPNSNNASRFLQEDEKFLFGNNNNNNNKNNNTNFVTQIYRPKKCYGIAMQYHLIRDRKQLSSFLVPLILNSSKLYSSKINTNNATGFEIKEVTGVVFCVGMGGAPCAAFGVGATSCLTYSLSHRMKQCIGILCKQTTANTTTTTNNNNNKKRSNATSATATTPLNLASARSLLTTLLLTDDEDRMANSVVNGEQRIDIFQEAQFTRRTTPISSSNKRRSNQQDNNNAFRIEGDNENPLQANSADQARIIVERMAVLSVCDSDSMFRKYENRQAKATRDAAAATTGKSGKKRMRKLAREDADLDGFDFLGKIRSSSTRNLDSRKNNNNNKNSSSVNNIGGDDVSVSARSTYTNASNLTLKGPRKDTASRTSNRSRQQPLSGLLASSSKDSSAMSRNHRMSVDHSVASAGAARSRHMGRRSTSIGHAIGGGRHNQNHSNYPSSTQSVESSDGGASLASPQGSIGSLNQQQTQGRQHFDPFSGGRATLSTDTSTTASETTFGQQDLLMNVNGNGNNGAAPAKVLVNIALNEDITCFYKLSKLTSCSVEGVVQVQVKSNVDQGVPFFLLIRDPSKCIQSIQENKKYADSMADTLVSNHHHRTSKSDYMFTVSVPKADDYFPVMRYKCGDELQPVPIVSTVLI